MILLKDQPTLTDLHNLIDRIDKYPIAAYELVELGRDRDAPEAVIRFYERFPEDEIFEDQFDLLDRTEEIEMLSHENAPAEGMLATED